VPKTNKTRFQLFEDKVWPEPNSGCWLWSGAKTSSGYGSFAMDRYRTIPAHRYAWICAYGSIPDGIDVCHRCDNPLCVNPEHLWLGTHTDNNSDRHRKGRSRGGSMKGTANPSAKIDWDAVKEIGSKKMSRSHYAAQYGITYWTVRDIETHRIWRTQQANQRTIGKII